MTKVLWVVFFGLFVQNILHAQSQVSISLINNSTHKFVFDRSVVGHSDNTIEIDKKTLLPGETATILGKTSSRADLSAKIYFNGDCFFQVVDRLQFHYGQPIFRLLANYVKSKLQSRKLNPVVGPRLLSYTGAVVVLTDLAFVEGTFHDRHDWLE